MIAFDLLIGMLIFSGISMAAVGLYARRFVGRVPAATPFILLMLCAGAWSILYALDLLAPSLTLRIFYHNLRFLFLPFLPVLELWLVLAYVNRAGWIRRDYAALVLIIPVLSAILAITSPYHTLFRNNFAIDTTGPFPVLSYDTGIFFQVHFLYSFILLASAIVILLSESRKKGTLWEWPTIILLVAIAFPTILNYITESTRLPYPGINLTPAFLWIAAILYSVALFRFHFLDIIPIARGRLIENLKKSVLVLDTDRRIIDMNPAAESLFGMRRSVSLGRTVEEIAADWQDLIRLCRADTAQKEELVRSTAGKSRYFIQTIEPLLSPDNQPEGYLIFLEEITDLKAAEEALREKTEELDQYFSTSLDLFCIADTRGFFRRLNPQWEKSLGYPLSDLEGKSFLDLVHPDDLQATLDAVADLRSQKEVLNFTNRYRHHDGSYRWIEWRSFPKGDRIFAAARDITERRRMEEALRESEEKYRTIIEEMQDLFYRTDKDGKIVMLSPSAIHIAGYDSIDQLIGNDVTSLYADPSERKRLLEAMREKGSVYAFPIRLKTRNGKILHVITSSHFYRNTAGDIAGVEGVIHDMTEQRQAEEALRIANKKLNLLSSITRHDIRNQLTALLAYLQLSEESIGNPAELTRYLERIRNIAGTIERQIAFTKDYEDMGVKAPSWQNVKSCIDTAATALPTGNIGIVFEPSGLEVFADPLFEKVFFNLIDNALRYGGERMTTLRITSRMAGSSLVIVFEDDGAGVAPQDKPRLFDKGFGKNTGLGLFLSREILSITGITITENGEPGKGARFEITVPEGGFRYTGTGTS